MTVGYHYCSNPHCFELYVGEPGELCLECEDEEGVEDAGSDLNERGEREASPGGSNNKEGQS